MSSENLREGIDYILAVKSSHRCGTERCSQFASCHLCLTDQILSYLKSQIKQIENPFEGYIDAFENIRMAKSQGFERLRHILLSKP